MSSEARKVGRLFQGAQPWLGELVSSSWPFLLLVEKVSREMCFSFHEQLRARGRAAACFLLQPLLSMSSAGPHGDY